MLAIFTLVYHFYCVMFAERDSFKAMTKAQFKKNQRVWVDSVGAWATVERVVPAWAGGLTEPVRITYDVGLGRMFHAAELTLDPNEASEPGVGGDAWRVARDRNKWRSLEETTRHPIPGTHPVVVTDPQDWGGWRVPRAEYDRDPARIEAQARIIAAAPKLRALAQELITLVADGATPEGLRGLARRAAAIELELRDLHGDSVKAPPVPPRTDRPAVSPSLNARSLSERMTALERELKQRAPAFARADPPPPRTEREVPPDAPTANFLRGRPK